MCLWVGQWMARIHYTLYTDCIWLLYTTLVAKASLTQRIKVFPALHSRPTLALQGRQYSRILMQFSAVCQSQAGAPQCKTQRCLLLCMILQRLQRLQVALRSCAELDAKSKCRNQIYHSHMSHINKSNKTHSSSMPSIAAFSSHLAHRRSQKLRSSYDSRGHVHHFHTFSASEVARNCMLSLSCTTRSFL